MLAGAESLQRIVRTRKVRVFGLPHRREQIQNSKQRAQAAGQSGTGPATIQSCRRRAVLSPVREFWKHAPADLADHRPTSPLGKRWLAQKSRARPARN